MLALWIYDQIFSQLEGSTDAIWAKGRAEQQKLTQDGSSSSSPGDSPAAASSRQPPRWVWPARGLDLTAFKHDLSGPIRAQDRQHGQSLADGRGGGGGV